MGFEPLGVHMFILFFAAMATITPPVAITSYSAATIAGASPMRVGFMSMKVGLVAYILPFVFIFKPEILQYGSFLMTSIAFVLAIAGTGIMAMGLEGWFFGKKTDFFSRLVLTVCGIAVVVGNLQILLIAAGIMIMVIVYIFTSDIVKKNKGRVRYEEK
jgi:TRAP-type uncharacterized transport system fused permease subunit